jgi:pyruvate-ferredoxin/flavodoxin oxidoreductase
MEELEEHLPGQAKKYIAENNIKFYTIDGIKIGNEIGLGGRINTILQSAFFKLSNIIPEEDAIRLMKEAAKKAYGSKGDDIVNMNYAAIERGAQDVVEIKVPDSWKNAIDESIVKVASGDRKDVVDFVNNIQIPINAQEGNQLPVSAFMDYVDGTTPSELQHLKNVVLQ